MELFPLRGITGLQQNKFLFSQLKIFREGKTVNKKMIYLFIYIGAGKGMLALIGRIVERP